MNNGIRVVNGGMQPQKKEPSYEESVRFQAKLIGLWEQQQSVLGYTKATIALNIRNVNEILDNVSVICAYVDGEDDVSTRIKGFIDSIAPDDSWIIFTDLFGGSVNNEFMKYISNPQIRLIAGMNLALVITAMSIVEMKNNAAEVEEELLGIADSVINFCSRTGIDSLEDDEF